MQASLFLLKINDSSVDIVDEDQNYHRTSDRFPGEGFQTDATPL